MSMTAQPYPLWCAEVTKIGRADQQPIIRVGRVIGWWTIDTVDTFEIKPMVSWETDDGRICYVSADGTNTSCFLADGRDQALDRAGDYVQSFRSARDGAGVR